MDKVKVNLVARSMDIRDYDPLCCEMINWLRDRKVSYMILHEDWHDLPTAVWIADPMDAVIFKLTFGL